MNDNNELRLGLVLSGGGSRAAYQVGALKALIPYLKKNNISIIIGSSIGSINGLILAACLKEGIEHAVDVLEKTWLERRFNNTFRGSPSSAFFRAIKVATVQYLSPGPKPNSKSIFDPTPLMNTLQKIIDDHGGLHPDNRVDYLESIGVMTAVEGKERKPLLFLSTKNKISDDFLTGASFSVSLTDNINSKHGFASAALPSVLPPVELDTENGKVRLVDGGIAQNTPVDPAVRLGAEKVILIDISGRDWWLRYHGESQDKRPDWEIPAGLDTFCMLPPETSVIRCQTPLGPILKKAVSGSLKKFIAAVGPTWPVFQLLKMKLGEAIAYETMTYVALDHDYIKLLIETGYNETITMLKNKEPQYHRDENFETWAKNCVE